MPAGVRYGLSMPVTRNAVVRKLQEGEVPIGALATDTAHESQLELLQRAGYDFLMLDDEHGEFPPDRIASICRVGRLAGFPVIVRTFCTYRHVRRALDLGSLGAILPMVDTAEQIDTLRRAALLPPAGERGPGGPGNRHVSDVRRETWAELEAQLAIIPMIETPRAVGDPALFDRPWVTACLVGPYDLMMSHGIALRDFYRPGGPHEAVIRRAIDGCARVGKPCGTVVPNGDGAARWIAMGARLIVCGELNAMLADQAKRNVDAIRTAAAVTAP